jgi:hypothetical protein
LKSGIILASEVPGSPQPAAAAADKKCSSPQHAGEMRAHQQESSTSKAEANAADEGREAAADGALSAVQQLKQPQELSSLYGLALSASVCMADLVRQVGNRDLA